jgi:hypothetical protein
MRARCGAVSGGTPGFPISAIKKLVSAASVASKDEKESNVAATASTIAIDAAKPFCGLLQDNLVIRCHACDSTRIHSMCTDILPIRAFDEA